MKSDSNISLFLTDIEKINQQVVSQKSFDSQPDAFNFYDEEMKSGNHGLFYFDPNKIGVSEWKKLGVPQYVFKRIEKYKNKGGKINSTEDLKKFAGNDHEWYNKIKNYVVIEKFNNSEYSNDKKLNETSVIILDLNVCTKNDLLLINGIGDKLSDRIIKFRELLGGYYSVSQLKEVFGIDSVKYRYIEKNFIVSEKNFKKIPINLADYQKLSAHPYIDNRHASDIINYRNRFGPFKSMHEFEISGIFADTVILKRILPYLSLWEEK